MKSRYYTKEYIEWLYKTPMKPCPKCGGYHIKHQTPIQIDLDGSETAQQILGKYARTTKDGSTPLKGPVFMMCRDCGHKGPAMDCSGRTSEDVRKDPKVSAEVKRLWNEQENLHRT